jgi:hypothetical protein
MCQVFSISGEKYNITTLREMMCRLLSKQRCAKDSLLAFKRQEELLKNSTVTVFNTVTDFSLVV